MEDPTAGPLADLLLRDVSPEKHGERWAKCNKVIAKINSVRKDKIKPRAENNVPRSISCPLCSQLFSSQPRQQRHALLRHCASAAGAAVGAVVCPVRRCAFTGADIDALGKHVSAAHSSGRFKVRTILFDVEGIEKDEEEEWVAEKEVVEDGEEEDEERVRCKEHGCDFVTSAMKRLRLHIYKRHRKLDGKTYTCMEEGCEFSTPNSTNLKIHYTKKHKDVQPRPEPVGIEAESPKVARTTRQGRLVSKKRRYVEENWDTEPPLEKKAKTEPRLPSAKPTGPVAGKSDSPLITPTSTRSRRSALASVPVPVEAPPDALPAVEQSKASIATAAPKSTSGAVNAEASPTSKRMRVKVQPHVISFSPVQKALITMTKIHSTMHDQISKIDCIMQKLIVEHANRCSSCKSSVEFCLNQNQFAVVAKSRESELEARIRDLEAQVTQLSNSIRKLSSTRAGNIPLKTLLEGVNKPNLQKEISLVFTFY